MPAAPGTATLRGAEPWAYFAIAALLDTIMGLRLSPQVLLGALADPDSYMRLVRLRDILAAHAPLHAVMRDASGAGAILHWSHLLDSLLLVAALPLRPWLGQAGALHAAAALSGPLAVGLLGIATAWAMAPFSLRRWRWTAPALTGLAVPIVGYGMPGVAHHHVLLALAAVMNAGLAGRAAAGDLAAGRRLGAWAGAALWLSPESVPFTVMGFGGAGLAWALRRPVAGQGGRMAVGNALAVAGSVFLAVVAAAFAVDPPMDGFGAIDIDRISVVYVVLAAIICAIAWLLWWLDRAAGAAARRVAGIAGTMAGLGLWPVLFPAVLAGPEGLLDADGSHAFLGLIQEMRPVASLAQALGFLLDGALAALLLGWLAVSRRSLPWGFAAICLGALLWSALLHVRLMIYPASAAAAMLPVMLTEWTRLLAARPAMVQAVARIGTIALMLLPNRVYSGLGGAAADDWSAAATASGAPSCQVSGLAPFLAPYAGAVVLTGVNDVPELLYRTGIITVGSLYHRNAAAFARLRAAWRSMPSDTVPDAVRATGATLVLACPRAGAATRWLLVRGLPPETLLDRLERGEVPPWLRQVASRPASGHVLYAILR